MFEFEGVDPDYIQSLLAIEFKQLNRRGKGLISAFTGRDEVEPGYADKLAKEHEEVPKDFRLGGTRYIYNPKTQNFDIE